MRLPERRGRWRNVFRDRRVRGLIEAAIVLTTYYLIPIRADRELGVRVLFTVIGLLVLGIIITRHVRRGSDPIDRLVLLLLGAIAALSLAFYATAASPGQFVGIETRTDALYFTVVTMATIGYGDIHATGQLGRILVVVAVLFQFVFLATLISTITRRLREADDD